MSKYHVGQLVRLVPIQGVCQKEHQGTVTSVTATQVGVTRAGAHEHHLGLRRAALPSGSGSRSHVFGDAVLGRNATALTLHGL